MKTLYCHAIFEAFEKTIDETLSIQINTIIKAIIFNSPMGNDILEIPARVSLTSPIGEKYLLKNVKLG